MQDEGRRSYVLRVKMTLFAHVLEGWQVSLTDNPGCDQGHDHVYDTALQSLKISSACFYVATYEQYRTRDTARFFRKMYEENKGEHACACVEPGVNATRGYIEGINLV